MGPMRNYHRMALECLELAEAARDPASQDMLIRMAELWASLADRAEEKSAAFGPPDGRSSAA
jgi:hypothetical protein